METGDGRLSLHWPAIKMEAVKSSVISRHSVNTLAGWQLADAADADAANRSTPAPHSQAASGQTMAADEANSPTMSYNDSAADEMLSADPQSVNGAASATTASSAAVEANSGAPADVQTDNSAPDSNQRSGSACTFPPHLNLNSSDQGGAQPQAMSPSANGLHAHHQDHYVKKEEAYGSSCLYSVDPHSSGVKQEDSGLMYGSSQVKLEADQLHPYHNAAIYDPQRTCWTSLSDRAAVAAAAVSGIYANQNHHLGRSADPYVDFASRPPALSMSSELDHYSALQKLTCTFPPSLATSSDGVRTSSGQCSTGVQSQQQPQQQQSAGQQQQQQTHNNSYRMNASAPLYAMSSLSYSEWTATNPSSHRSLSANTGATSLTSSAPVTKGQFVLHLILELSKLLNYM